MRAKPGRRTLERLALVGALDGVAGITAGEVFTRGDVLARVRQLNAIKKRPAPRDDQPTLDFSNLDFANLEQLPKGNAEMSLTERVQYELDILHLDVSQHVLDQYRPMLDEMGVVNSSELAGLRGKSEVLVAGVRVATQTPPMKSGKRVVFITLDDGTGCSDSTFFDEAQSRCSHILFNTKLVIISGKTRRTGVRGVSIMAENAWDLKELWNQWLIAVEDRKQTQNFYV
jgi:error-prone DNA polymerase